MSSPQPKQETPQQKVQLMRLLSFFFCGSILILVGVCSIKVPFSLDFHRFVRQLQNSQSAILFGAAIVQLAFRNLIADFTLKAALKAQAEPSELTFFRTYTIAHVLRLALAEGSVVLGLVMVLTSGEKEWMGFSLIVVAALLAIVNELPTYESIKAHFRHLDPKAKF